MCDEADSLGDAAFDYADYGMSRYWRLDENQAVKSKNALDTAAIDSAAARQIDQIKPLERAG